MLELQTPAWGQGKKGGCGVLQRAQGQDCRAPGFWIEDQGFSVQL